MLLFCAAMLMISNILCWVKRGDTSPENILFLKIFSFLDYAFSYQVSFGFITYMYTYVKRDLINNIIYWGVTIVAGACTVLSAISVFTGWVFYIDEIGLRQMGPLDPYIESSGVIILMFIFAAMLNNHASLGKSRLFVLASYVVFPAIGMIVEFSLDIQLSVFNLGIGTSVLVLFFSSIIEDQRASVVQQKLIIIQKEQLMERERALNDLRLQIFRSQIQPHFIYNVLNTIYYLCEKDPAQAQEAIATFSDYLRCNMDSLTKKENVPFEDEFVHIKQYLELEQMRFGDELCVEYDIKETEFSIPALSLQPIVENAVKHGVGKKEGGGTVVISTSRGEREYIICVRDDGVGFDTSEMKEDGRSHIGLDNVRRRIATMCKGTLEVRSVKGVGTEVKIYIPILSIC
ncbi:MAG: histidine kinase [Eubacterium sp.]|nr:histidine kinase [Eubacterium sp.]